MDFQLELGAQGLTILGVLGEAAKLSVDERQEVMETVMATVNGRVPVVVGASHQDDDTRLALCQAAEVAGAAGVMVAPPRMADRTRRKCVRDLRRHRGNMRPRNCGAGFPARKRHHHVTGAHRLYRAGHP